MIGVIDSGLGNVASLGNMFKRLGAPSALVSTPEQIAEAERLILPGVGAFDHGMESLRERGLLDALHVAAMDRKKPVLGICLGMQLLARSSEEGQESGLGWIGADIVRFDAKRALGGIRVPHMGWNQVSPSPDARLFDDSEPEQRFYFVHSYHMVCDDENLVAATSEHGGAFVSAVQQGNLFGVQFHPEKSHRFGMRLLDRFAHTPIDDLVAPAPATREAAPRIAS